MRIKKKQIREKLNTAELQQNANKIVDVAGNVKSQFKGLGMSDDEAAGAVADMMNISSDDVNEVNQEVMDKFEDQYGKEKSEDIYYATANKQDRDPESFELNEMGGEINSDIMANIINSMQVNLSSYGTFDNHPELKKAIREKLYWAVMDAYDDYRRAQGGTISEIDPGTGEDFGDIPTGRDIEAGADDYEEYQNLLRGLGDKETTSMGNDVELNYGEEPNDLPFESVNPKMTKDQLIETINGKKQRRVIKTIKVKDLK